MGFKFNPFSGTFDATGASDAAPFAGQVDAYADLPLDSTAALNSRWLVKNNSGTWPFSTYKQAGIYIRVNTVGASRDNDYQFVGTLPSVMNDNEFLIYDDADATKNLKFQLSGISTGATRTITVPNKNVTLDDASDARTPLSHAASHGALGGDPLTNIDQASINSSLGNNNLQDDISYLNSTLGTLGTAAFVDSTTFAAASHTHAASAITSGVLDNARINFASPPAIGGTSAAAGSFTTLSASTSLTLGTSGILSGGTNTIEQRNTTSAQTFRIYNTVSGAADANFERGFMRWSSNVLQIGTEAGGTGSNRSLEIRQGVSGNWGFSIFRDTTRILGSYDNDIFCDSATTFGWSSRLRLTASADGRLLMRDSATTGFDRLQFGGTTSSFPALKRSSTTLQVRLADDSAFAPLSCGALTLNGNLDASTRDIVTDTTTGTKIGTATTQKIGFFNATPVVQQAAIADATDAATTQARLNDLLAAMRSLGLIAT